MDRDLRRRVGSRLGALARPVLPKTSWTTDAPFRETATALRLARDAGADIVEMEAAALYAFGQASGMAVVCLAQVTNGMAVTELDFEKGAANGAEAACEVIVAVASEAGHALP
jgi:uridine phosphorylase